MTTEQTKQETFNATAGRLRSLVERVERLTEEKKAITDDISEVFKEAKGEGWDIPGMKAIIKIRASDEGDIAEADAILETYKQSLGMS